MQLVDLASLYAKPGRTSPKHCGSEALRFKRDRDLPGCAAPRQRTSWSAELGLSRLGRATGQIRTHG